MYLTKISEDYIANNFTCQKYEVLLHAFSAKYHILTVVQR